MSKTKHKVEAAPTAEKNKSVPVEETAAVSEPAPQAEIAAAATAVKPVKPYYAGIDIVKILAVFLVVSIHFFLYNGFYYTPLTDRSCVVPIVFRWFAYTCVPLFMISTGYLMKNKTFSLGYYKGIIKILVIYVVVAIINVKFNIAHYGHTFDTWKLLKGFFEYSNANYAWYVNYYVALFMLIPFLNLAFNGLKTRNQKLMLVITVTCVTVMARSFFLGFEKDNQIRVFPDYLSGAYPLAYYYAGAYIREYPPKRNLKNKLLALVLFCASLFFISYSTYRQTLANDADDHHFLSWHFNDYSSYPIFFLTLSIFILLFDITTKNKGVKFVLRQISGATLATYLISYVFDNTFYNSFQREEKGQIVEYIGFNNKYPELLDKFSHWYEIVLKNFGLALLCGLVIHNLYNLAEWLIKKAVAKIKARKSSDSAEAAADS